MTDFSFVRNNLLIYGWRNLIFFLRIKDFFRVIRSFDCNLFLVFYLLVWRKRKVATVSHKNGQNFICSKDSLLYAYVYYRLTQKSFFWAVSTLNDLKRHFEESSLVKILISKILTKLSQFYPRWNINIPTLSFNHLRITENISSCLLENSNLSVFVNYVFYSFQLPVFLDNFKVKWNLKKKSEVLTFYIKFLLILVF